MDARRKSIFVGQKSRQHKQQIGDTVNLASRLKMKKKKWKVTVNPEVNDDDEEECLKKDIVYTKPIFDSDKIYQAIADIVNKKFEKGEDGESYRYNASENVNLCQQISKDIRDTLKTWRQLMRFRIVALTSVIEKSRQGIHYKMKNLIDPKTDNYVKYYLDNPNFYIIVCVILIYQD